MERFDFIIAGTGAAGLQLAWFMSRDPWFSDKRVLMIDRDEKKSNDRTWCFWERGEGVWDEVVCKTWHQVFFSGENFSKCFDLGEFSYKMIRSADFYAYVLKEIRSRNNFHFVHARVDDICDGPDGAVVSTPAGNFKGTKVFSSIPAAGAMENARKGLWLSQHFKGWFVKSATPVFDEKVAVMMDYSVEQKGNTRFMYVLPVTPHEALVEYTLFSAGLLDEKEYDDEIKHYLHGLGCFDYQVNETETGQIPMTTYPFWKLNSKNVLYIGTAGGWTKASSGYTFHFSGKKSAALINFVKSNQNLSRFHKNSRFGFYDQVMLDLLVRRNDLGKLFFTSVYKNQPIERVLDFLNEESGIPDEARIILSSQPRVELLKSVMRVMRM
jgi:lycopene beta-cyclase